MSDPVSGLRPVERRAVVGLGGILSVRILGLFLLLPVLALYTESMPGATPAKIGLAIGVYGLTQALLQIPFGHLSDLWGRKQVIAGGLVLFAMGGMVAATSDSVNGIVLGRAMQGAGAISAAVTALLADLTRDNRRTRAMAFVGAGIGLTFILAIVSGPILANIMGVPGIFWLTVGLSVFALFLLAFLVPPQPNNIAAQSPPRITQGLMTALGERALLRLYVGIFVLHWIMTALFVSVPFVLRDDILLAQGAHWQVYLGAVVLSLLGTVPLVLRAERGPSPLGVFLVAILFLVFSQILLALAPVSIAWVVGALVVFFAGFNFLEARLPALVSRTAPQNIRGAALGVYATFQFLGAFSGGLLGGWLMGVWGSAWVFTTAAVLAAAWAIYIGLSEFQPSSG